VPNTKSFPKDFIEDMNLVIKVVNKILAKGPYHR